MHYSGAFESLPPGGFMKMVYYMIQFYTWTQISTKSRNGAFIAVIHFTVKIIGSSIINYRVFNNKHNSYSKLSVKQPLKQLIKQPLKQPLVCN